jgi:hypothetical protein
MGLPLLGGAKSLDARSWGIIRIILEEEVGVAVALELLALFVAASGWTLLAMTAPC